MVITAIVHMDLIASTVHFTEMDLDGMLASIVTFSITLITIGDITEHLITAIIGDYTRITILTTMVVDTMAAADITALSEAEYEIVQIMAHDLLEEAKMA